jgi:geranylgeranyl reductase family protein
MLNELKYDILIIGGGPAGSSLAYFLSRKNMYRIALVEGKPWKDVWGKPCGNAIGAHHFAERGLVEPPSEAIKQVVNGVEIYSPREDVVLRAYGKGFIIDRTRFGQYLLKASMDKGVEVFLSSHAKKLLIENNEVVGAQAVIDGGEKIIHAKIVIDATGAASPLRKQLPPHLPVAEQLDPRDSDLAFREILEIGQDIERPDFIRIYLDQNVAPGGYWWYFPEGRNQVNLGLGVQNGVNNPDPRTQYRKFLLARKDVQPVLKVISSAGAIVPTRRPLDSLVWNRYIVIGDAAFTVNPVHGGGMGYAIESAYCSSLAIDHAFEKSDFTVNGLWETNTCYMPNIGAKQAALEVVRYFLQKLSNEELQFIMEKKIVSEEDVDILSRKAELKSDVIANIQGALSDLGKLFRGLKKPSLLMKLKKLSDYMEEMKKLYRNYPSTPNGLDAWRESVKALVESYRREFE